MKINNSHHQKEACKAKSPAPAPLVHSETNFAPSVDEIARRAYFNYESQGSVPGHDIQHWLKAEAELLAERNLTRVHGFHNRS
jgi:hypothetical protein